MASNRSKAYVLRWLIRQADHDGYLDRATQHLTARFGWTVRRAEKFLASHQLPDDVRNDKALNEAIDKGLVLFKLNADTYYVVTHVARKYEARIERERRYKLRWDHKHRPSGHAEALRRHPKPPKQPPAQPILPPGYVNLADRRCPNKARFGNQNARKTRPQPKSPEKHTSTKCREA
jgi:hypothetical protein